MTVDDLIFDRVSPDAPGLNLPVTDAAAADWGYLRSAMLGRPGKQILRWQGFRPDGFTTTGPIWATREEAAPGLLIQPQRPAGAADAADSSMTQA